MTHRSNDGLDAPTVLNVVRRNFTFAFLGGEKVDEGGKHPVPSGVVRRCRDRHRVKGDDHQMLDTSRR